MVNRSGVCYTKDKEKPCVRIKLNGTIVEVDRSRYDRESVTYEKHRHHGKYEGNRIRHGE